MEKIVLLHILIMLLCMEGLAMDRSPSGPSWKAGVAKINITPEHSMWLAGFASRDRPSEGKLHELWAKALAFEDAGGQQAVLVTMDLLGVTKSISDHIRDQVETKYGLSSAQIVLNSSHTHSGPVLHNALVDIYPMDDFQRSRVEQYSRELEDSIVRLVGEALQALKPAQLYAENGVTRFQVNRRNNSSSTLHRYRQTEIKGPSDYAVPVLKVVNEAGELMAVAFGYACHPVDLNDYEWSGDYVGYAQLELEKAYPGVTALFFQGAGGDQNPMPRGSVAWAQQHGRSLAAAVMGVLSQDMRPLSSRLSTAYSEIDLSFASPPGKEALSQFAEEASGYQQRWAMRLLEKLERGESLMKSYPYPVQVWQLGDQLMVSLGGEVVVDYAIELKRIFGLDTFVLGYSNDVMAYIPSVRILREGGYEGASSQIVYGQPSPWAASIETLIFQEVMKLADQVGVLLPESKLIGE